MIEILVDRIKVIDKIPSYVSVDKDKEIREEFEEWKTKNPVVHTVMEGKTTFLQEYQKAFGEYTKERVFKPYSLPKDFKEKVADLEACIGDSDLGDSMVHKSLMNPTGSSLVYGSAGLAAAGAAIGINQINKQQGIDRRTFLINVTLLVGAPIATGFIGIYVGSLSATGVHRNLELLKGDAIYLDTLYTKLYKK
ncbi:hypothetical protein HYW20_02990 [Candidatus Woesearchaeota archaeon]|nr:hypothetical protein [Candidatus Woesearchaeota archaeon]